MKLKYLKNTGLVILILTLISSLTYDIFFQDWGFNKGLYFNLFWSVYYSALVIFFLMIFRLILFRTKINSMILALLLSLLFYAYLSFKSGFNILTLTITVCLFLFCWIIFLVIKSYRNAFYFISVVFSVLIFYATFNPIDRAEPPVDLEIISVNGNGKVVVREYWNPKSKSMIKDTVQVEDRAIFRKIIE